MRARGATQDAQVAADLWPGTEARLFDWTVERERLARALSDPLGEEHGGEGARRDDALTVAARYREIRVTEIYS